MVNLHRWLKKTSPHLVIVGSLIITGLSGCRSAQFTAFEVESPTPSYPTPLVVQDAVTKTAPYTEPNAAPSAEDVTKELVLEPPTPPLANSGSNSGTGSSQALPLPEIEYPKVETSKKFPISVLTQAKPQLKAARKKPPALMRPQALSIRRNCFTRTIRNQPTYRRPARQMRPTLS